LIRNRTVIGLLAAAQFVMVLDTTVMNVSITQVAKDVNASITDMQLAITAYALVMAALMLTGAKLGDVWGRRRTFAIGLCVYGAGSLTTALSPSFSVLLIGWSGIEGLGAAMVIPAIAALTAASYSGQERARAFGLIGGVSGAGAAVGPLIGGAVTTALTWRLVFAGEVVIVLIVLMFIRRMPAPAARGGKIDVVGSLLSGCGLGLIVFGILKISEWGFFTPKDALTIGDTRITPFGFSVVPFMIAAGLVLLALFLRWERRMLEHGSEPLLDPDLLRVPQLRSGLVNVMSMYLVLAGTFFVLPLFLQLVLEEDALHTGLKLLPISITMMVAALGGGRLASRIAPATVVMSGMGILFVSIAGLMSTISITLDSVPFAISLAGFGLGIGLVLSQVGNVVMSSVPDARSSEAGGVQGASQNLGQSLGTALIGAVLLTGLASGFQERIVSSDVLPSTVKQQVEHASVQGVPMISRSEAQAVAAEAQLPKEQEDALVNSYEEAQIEGLKRALLWAAGFALLGVLLGRGLPREPLLVDEDSERDAVQTAPSVTTA
jgi:MFS family permease